MRKIILVAAVVPAAALGVVLATGRLRERHEAAPPVVAAAYVSVPAVATAAPPPAPQPADDLPTVEVKPFVVHTAPSDADTLPAQPYTMVPIAGRIAERAPARTEAPRRRATPVSLEPAFLAGPAAAAGGTALDIEGHRLALFGVKLLPRDDGAAARAALQKHLAAAASVTCAAPPGQAGTAGFVCRDRAGVDLGEFLVTQGLAAADRSQSYQYVADEERARAERLGAWRQR